MDGPCHREVAEFEHDTLPDASKYIRLVEVLEGNHYVAFQARFRMSTWRIDGLPSYHAISYTWGDPESNTAIMINGKTFRVRKNCEFALKQAWWHKSNGHYCIDAICINQTNDEEKGKQVAMMGNIYKTAYNVLACVGNHVDDSLFLHRHLASTDEACGSLYSFPNTRDLVRKAHRLLTVRRYLRAAVHFAKRSYFSRLWIVQELSASRRAYVLCGADALPKQKIFWLLCDLDTTAIVKPPRLAFSRARRLAHLTLRAVFYRRSSHDDPSSTELENAIFVTSDSFNKARLSFRSDSLQCTQRRDRIYGIMSVVDWGEVIPPSPDYTKSDFEVVLDCIKPVLDLTRGEGYVELQEICYYLQRALELTNRSDSVSEALKARRGARDSNFVGYLMPNDLPPTQLQSEARGWCLSGEHFISRRQSTFSEWKVPNSTGVTAILPHWLREGDWRVEPSKLYCAGETFLVLRDAAAGIYSLILGQGHLSLGSMDNVPPDAIFQIFWDTEDLLVHYLVNREPSSFGTSQVDFGVCRRDKPDSSYALRQNQGPASTKRDLNVSTWLDL